MDNGVRAVRSGSGTGKQSIHTQKLISMHTYIHLGKLLTPYRDSQTWRDKTCPHCGAVLDSASESPDPASARAAHRTMGSLTHGSEDIFHFDTKH